VVGSPVKNRQVFKVVGSKPMSCAPTKFVAKFFQYFLLYVGIFLNTHSLEMMEIVFNFNEIMY